MYIFSGFITFKVLQIQNITDVCVYVQSVCHKIIHWKDIRSNTEGGEEHLFKKQARILSYRRCNILTGIVHSGTISASLNATRSIVKSNYANAARL